MRVGDDSSEKMNCPRDTLQLWRKMAEMRGEEEGGGRIAVRTLLDMVYENCR
jgi:hypothetical protein